MGGGVAGGAGALLRGCDPAVPADGLVAPLRAAVVLPGPRLRACRHAAGQAAGRARHPRLPRFAK